MLDSGQDANSGDVQEGESREAENEERGAATPQSVYLSWAMLVKSIVDYTQIDYERVWDMNIMRVYGLVAEMQHYNKKQEERIKQWRKRN